MNSIEIRAVYIQKTVKENKFIQPLGPPYQSKFIKRKKIS